jgi:hypothetical protein
MSATTVELLKAAAEAVGGSKALAGRLGVGETLLARFMADRCELPDSLLLRAVDIILADRQHRVSPPDGLERLPPSAEHLQNCGRGGCPTPETGSA